MAAALASPLLHARVVFHLFFLPTPSTHGNFPQRPSNDMGISDDWRWNRKRREQWEVVLVVSYSTTTWKLWRWEVGEQLGRQWHQHCPHSQSPVVSEIHFSSCSYVIPDLWDYKVWEFYHCPNDHPVSNLLLGKGEGQEKCENLLENTILSL